MFNVNNQRMKALSPMKVRIAILVIVFLFGGSDVVSAQDRIGSIYRPNRGPQGPIANKTARRKGDLITVLISETQDVSNQETSNIKRETSLDYALTDLDLTPNAFSTLPSLGGNSADELKGTANYAKKGDFTARVTAIIVDTHPNGNLVISGRREIRIDQEIKVLEISGIIRRFDILPDNTIVSEKVADARVSYAGSGPLTDATNRTGFAAFVVDALRWLWPF
ncbi:MAG: flagellar L-ring protein precursor FlgH [Planctomycetota bacterium]|jgi:flagellar L-ring protein precursor FlgH